MSMSDKELNAIVHNEIEWRKQLWKKVERIETNHNDFKIQMVEVTTSLKVKIGMAGAIFGFIGGAIVQIFSAIIK